mgnify:CR=1 FL=1
MWKQSPIVRPAIAVILGICGMNFCLEVTRFSVFLTLAILMLNVVIVCALYYYKPWNKNHKAFGLAVLTAFALLGALLFQSKYINVENNSHQGRRLRVGTAITRPVEKERWWTFRLREKDGGVTMVYLAKGDSVHPENIRPGDSIYVLSYFNYPTSPYLRKLEQKEIDKRTNQMLKTKKDRYAKRERKENKSKKLKGKNKKNNNARNNLIEDNDSIYVRERGSFNLIDDEFEGYKRYLFYQGISSVAFSSEAAWDFYYDKPDGLISHRTSMPFFNDLAGKMHELYSLAGFSDEAEALVDAMTTGNKTAISKETKDKFSKAGISHVLALSGFHLTVIVTLLDVLLMRGLFKRKWRKFTALIIIPVIWAFAFIAGLPPSLVRATAMCSVIQLAMVIGNVQQLKNACGIALFVMLLWNPMLVMDVGFQLSFLSIIGIAMIGIPLSEWFRYKVGKWGYVTDVIVISMVCTLFTFPVVAYHFGQVPIYSILSNLLVSIVATLFMWAAIMWWIFVWCIPVNDAITHILDFLANTMVFIADKVAGLPFATVQYKPCLLELPLIYITGAFVFHFIKKRKATYLYAALAFLALICIIHVLI